MFEGSNGAVDAAQFLAEFRNHRIEIDDV